MISTSQNLHLKHRLHHVYAIELLHDLRRAILSHVPASLKHWNTKDPPSFLSLRCPTALYMWTDNLQKKHEACSLVRLWSLMWKADGLCPVTGRTAQTILPSSNGTGHLAQNGHYSSSHPNFSTVPQICISTTLQFAHLGHLLE